MRPFLMILLFIVPLAPLANAEDQPRKVTIRPDGSRVECYGGFCRIIPAAVGKVIDAIPTPADIREKPIEAVSVASPVQVKSVLVSPVQATKNVVHSVRYHRSGPLRHVRIIRR